MNTNEPICTGCGHPRSRAIKAVIEGCIACCSDCDVLGMDDRNLIREPVAVAELKAVREENARLSEALQRIASFTDAPDIDPIGDIQFGLHCGVEDRNCSDRYEGADFGYTQGVERAFEWVKNEATYALSKLKPFVSPEP